HVEPGRTRPATSENPAEDLRAADQRATYQRPVQDPRLRLQRSEERPRQDAGPARCHPRTALDTGPTRSHLTDPPTANINRRTPANRPSRYATTRNPCAHHLNVCLQPRAVGPSNGSVREGDSARPAGGIHTVPVVGVEFSR